MRGRTPPPQAPQFPPLIPLNSHDKAGAHAEAAELARQGVWGIWIVQDLHDDACPAADSHRDQDCSCTPDYVLMSPEAHQSLMSFDAEMRVRAKAGLN